MHPEVKKHYQAIGRKGAAKRFAGMTKEEISAEMRRSRLANPITARFGFKRKKDD
jgi:hypothetical protein